MITYDPKRMLERLAPPAKLKRLLKKDLTLKRAALSFVDELEFLDRAKVTEVALKTIRGYQERVARAQAEGGFEPSAGDELEGGLVKDPRQLVQRVQNEIVLQISGEIRSKYAGEKYEWLPSDAEEPDPEHQLNYGKVFTIGEGEMPGERIGCKCGMRILVDETELDLS